VARRIQRRLTTPLVTVVVTTQDSEGWVRRCLQSIRRQQHRRLQIVVVDAASGDATLEIVRALAARDERIEVLTRDSRGVGGARNAGAAHAKGRFLIFVDAGDVLPRGAINALVSSLRRSGSDLAVGRPRKATAGGLTDPHWAVDVHRFDRRRLTVDDFPDVMGDLLLGDRMFRTDFWRRNELSFPADVPQSAATLASAYVDAERLDVLSAVTLHWAPSEGDGLLGSKVLDVAEARAFAADVRAATRHVDERGTAAEKDAWVARVLDIELEPRIRACVDAEPQAREVLQDLAATFVGRADTAVLDRVRFAVKALAFAAAGGRWTDVEHLVEHFSLHGSRPATEVVDGHVLAEAARLPGLAVPLPPEHLRLSRAETELGAAVQRVRWVGDELEVTGWAFIRGLDLADTEQEVRVRLVDGNGVAHELETRSVTMAPATRWANDPEQRYDSAGFVTVVRPSTLALLGSRPQAEKAWRFEVSVSACGVERTGALRTLVQAGSAGVLRAAMVDGVLVAPVLSVTYGLTLRVRRPGVRAERLDVVGDTLVATLRTEDVEVDRVRMWAGRYRQRVEAPVTHEPDGTLTVRLRLPAGVSSRRNRVWKLRAVTPRGDMRQIAWAHPSDGSRIAGEPGPETVVWRRTPRGHVEVVQNLSVIEVVDVARRDGLLQLVVEHAGALPPHAAALTSPRVTVAALDVRTTGSRTEIDFPLTAARWGRPALPLRSGLYELSVDTEEGPRHPWPSWSLLDRLPEEDDDSQVIARIGRQRPGRTTLRLRAPLTDEEWGRTAQRRMQRAHQVAEPRPEDAFLFQCYRGEVATDSQRALHDELHRRGAPLALYWGVADHSVDLPEGARPVLIGSARWYELLTNARYLSNNVDFPRWWVRRPHQTFIQTFHGYPFKSMGVSFWKEQGRNERDLVRETTRLGRAWSVALVPAEFCTDLYRREYRFDGEIMVSGYPRNDVLVGPAAVALRARVRAQLGIGESQRAVLYAPTWRESISADTWNAPMFDALDIDALSTELGSDHVILLRGHNHNLGDAARFTDHAAVLDVTDHPEINELVLASDVAVLDYSSLRFDYALTGRPMVFFVPDLEDYVAGRSFLFDYEPTAPGPWARTTEEVVEAIQRLDDVGAEYAGAIAEFNRRFNELNDGRAAARVIDAWVPEARTALPVGASGAADRTR
jgi:CDP-glycerol glycerophosphotransferase